MAVIDGRIRRDQKVVKAVLARDGGICQCCGNANGAEVHHIEPLWIGGADEQNNCICLCCTCHANVPDDPALFYKYQRAAGSLLHLFKEVLGPSNLHLFEEVSPEERKRIASQFREQRWGWISGISLPYQDFKEGKLTKLEALLDIAELLDNAATTTGWVRRMCGSPRVALPKKSLHQQLQLKISDCQPRKAFEEFDQIFREYACLRIFDCFSTELCEAIETLKPVSPISLEHLTSLVDCAVEDVHLMLPKAELLEALGAQG